VQMSRTINVKDTTKPEITLNGDSTITLEAGSIYSDPGAGATDNYDGIITANMVATVSKDGTNITSVNKDVVGQYMLSYNVQDSGNYAQQVARTVNVVDPYNSTFVKFADINKSGSEITLMYGEMLNLSSHIDPTKFSINGTDVTVAHADYVAADASHQSIKLFLSEPISSSQFISVNIAAGAVNNYDGQGLPAVTHRGVFTPHEFQTVRSDFDFNADGFHADDIVKAIIQQKDVTRDQVFDKYDILYLLKQLDILSSLN